MLLATASSYRHGVVVVGAVAVVPQALRSSLSRGPVLVLALRGLQARQKLQRVLGPMPHSLALLEVGQPASQRLHSTVIS